MGTVIKRILCVIRLSLSRAAMLSRVGLPEGRAGGDSEVAHVCHWEWWLRHLMLPTLLGLIQDDRHAGAGDRIIGPCLPSDY